VSAIWVEIGRAADVPLWEGRRVTLPDGRRIAVFHTDAGFLAVDAVCPHADGPLQDGLVADGCVTCPLHGWRFDLRDGSRIGARDGDAEATLATYEVEIGGEGELLLLVAAGELASAAS
jgi:nitrite reductase (NADH) small subunit